MTIIEDLLFFPLVQALPRAPSGRANQAPVLFPRCRCSRSARSAVPSRRSSRATLAPHRGRPPSLAEGPRPGRGSGLSCPAPGSPTWCGAPGSREGGGERAGHGRRTGQPRLSRHRGCSILPRQRRPLPHARLQPTAAPQPRSYRLLAAGRPRPPARRSPAPAGGASTCGAGPGPARLPLRRSLGTPRAASASPASQSGRAAKRARSPPLPPGGTGDAPMAGAETPAARDQVVRLPPRGKSYREVSPRI